MFDDWRDALVIPVPKRGNLNIWDNWRGISLLDVVASCWVGFFKRDYRLLQRAYYLTLNVVWRKVGNTIVFFLHYSSI